MWVAGELTADSEPVTFQTHFLKPVPSQARYFPSLSCNKPFISRTCWFQSLFRSRFKAHLRCLPILSYCYQLNEKLSVTASPISLPPSLTHTHTPDLKPFCLYMTQRAHTDTQTTHALTHTRSYHPPDNQLTPASESGAKHGLHKDIKWLGGDAAVDAGQGRVRVG